MRSFRSATGMVPDIFSRIIFSVVFYSGITFEYFMRIFFSRSNFMFVSVKNLLQR